MDFWNRQKKIAQVLPADAGRVRKSKKGVKRARPVALEVKLLAIEALESGLSPSDVARDRARIAVRIGGDPSLLARAARQEAPSGSVRAAAMPTLSCAPGPSASSYG